jgi:antitoxin component YwqK of YwqJK toxin-antitoxin module
MKLKLAIILLLSAAPSTVYCQTPTSVNQTDPAGRKQGHWIKRYLDNSIQYEGFFRDDHPVGEFRRYYRDSVLKSVLKFSNDGREASAVLYYPNGNIASRGKYINQKKEGKWQFFSETIREYMYAEVIYKSDLRNGPAVSYYPDSTIAEKVIYVNDLRNGEWTRYYPSGALLLKSSHVNGKIDGKFETWFENGKPEFTGQYRKDGRDGPWVIYNEDGSVRYRLQYTDGITSDRQMDIDLARELEEREKNHDNVQDPEKKGVLKQQ